MKIIYLHQYFNTPQMTGSTRSYEMARRLVNDRHEVHMITSDRSGLIYRGWRITNEEGIIVHWFPVPYSNRMSYRSRIKAFIHFAWKAASRAASIPADVVFATSTPLTIALPAVYAARRQRIPMVFEVRDLWPELPIAVKALRGMIPIGLARWLEKFAYYNATAVVALSPGIKEGIIRRGYPAERIHVIPNSCDLELFQVPNEAGKAFRCRFDWLGDHPLVVYVGTFGRINDVSYLTKLAAEARSIAPDIRFLAVGDGQEYEKVMALAHELGVINQNFFMLPKVPKLEIPAILSASTIATSLFINLPEMWSNSANKFFDALAAGRPIAINYGGWQANLLRETDAGLVIAAEDVVKATHKLIASLRNYMWLDNAKAAALKLARSRFDRNILAKQLEQVLHDYVSN